MPDFASNSWHAVEGATGHGESDHARYSPSPSRMSGAFDDLFNGLPVPSRRAHSRSSGLLSTTSAPLMRSVSRCSRSSEAVSDHIPSNGNSVLKDGKTTPLPNSLLDASGEHSMDTVQSSPASVTSRPRRDHPSSTGQRRISNPNATSLLLNTAVADVSQAISSSVANSIKAGTFDEAQMQMILRTSLLNLIGSQASSQRPVRNQSSNRSAARGEPLSCDECHKSVARLCDMKYVHLRSSTSCSKY